MRLFVSISETITKTILMVRHFYGVLLNEVKSMRKDREDLVDIVVRYILEHEEENIKELATYLSKKIDE